MASLYIEYIEKGPSDGDLMFLNGTKMAISPKSAGDNTICMANQTSLKEDDPKHTALLHTCLERPHVRAVAQDRFLLYFPIYCRFTMK